MYAGVPSTSPVLVSCTLGASLPAASAELYDPALDTWTPAPSMTAARAGHTMTPTAGVIVVAGGWAKDGVLLLWGDEDSPQASAEVYHPELKAWTTTPWMSTARAGHTATPLDSGAIVLVGGWASGMTCTDCGWGDGTARCPRPQ